MQGAALSVRNREQPVRQAQQQVSEYVTTESRLLMTCLLWRTTWQILAACGVEMTSSELQRWLETRRVYDLAEGTHAKFSMRQLSLYARFQEALWQVGPLNRGLFGFTVSVVPVFYGGSLLWCLRPARQSLVTQPSPDFPRLASFSRSWNGDVLQGIECRCAVTEN